VAFYILHLEAEAKREATPLSVIVKRFLDEKEREGHARRLQDARALAGWDVVTWPANALRKTFISCHYESFGSVDSTAKEAGTSVAMIHAHYR